MKKLIFILSLFISITVKSATYYVSTTGSDAAAGSLAAPWASWQKAFNTADAGDTVYFRGGTWYATEYIKHNPTGGNGNNGTYSNPICFFNYPGETPIFNAINYTQSWFGTPGYGYGIELTGSTYINIKGLTFCYVKEVVINEWIAGVHVVNCGVISLDNVKSHDNGGYGFSFQGWDTLYVNNCDSYNNADSTSLDNEGNPDYGNRADGFAGGAGGTSADTLKVIYFTGCRAWHNSDDGFDFGSTKQYIVSNCWSFANGGFLPYGGGNGYKVGNSNVKVAEKRRISHNLSAFNHYNGFAIENLISSSLGPVNAFYNNTSYRDRISFTSDDGSFNCTTGYKNVVYKNNLGYQVHYSSNQYYKVYITLCAGTANYIPQDNNSWRYSSSSPYWLNSLTVSVSDADFLFIGYTENDSLSAMSELKAARKSDGSLPEITFLKLTAGSDLIDAGVDVGLPYEGAAPDIGYDEWVDAPDSTATDILTFTFPEQTGLATINTTEHTVAISVTNGTAVTTLTPTITMSYGATIAPLSGVEDDFTDPVVYTVTALDGETTQEWTVTVTVADPDVPTVTTSLVTTYNAASATLSGEVISNGATTLTATGFVWSVSESPTLANGNIVPNTTRTETTFSNSISPLQKGTTYHIRAFGTNSAGTAYGSDVSFTTPALGMIQSGGKTLFNNGKQIKY